MAIFTNVMNKQIANQLSTPWRRLLAGVLVVCLTLAAVPALAHCCADRCHDAEPVTAETDDCDCTLSGVEPPVDALSFVPDSATDLVCISGRVLVDDDAPRACRDAAPDAAAPRGAPDRTVVLLI